MHILIITSWYTDVNDPVTGSFVEGQARMLQKYGHTVSVLHAYINGTFMDTLKGCKETYSIENNKGIITMRLATNVYIPKIRSLSYYRLSRKALQIVKKYITKYGQIDIIHSHAMFMGGVVAHYINKKLGITYFHTEHTSGFLFNKIQYTKQDIQRMRKVFLDSKRTFFVSEYQKERMKQICHIDSANLQVLHNVVPSIFFNNYEVNRFENFTFVVIASMTKRKNLDVVIDAWQLYVKNNTNDKLIIVGDGPLWDMLSGMIVSKELTQSVTMMHRISREEVVALLRKSHVLLSASDVETFGMTVAEALAVGIPVVTTNSGGVLDIMTEDTGIVVDGVSKETFANAMCKVRENFFIYDSNNLREYARNRFSEDIIYCKLLMNYSSAL